MVGTTTPHADRPLVSVEVIGAVATITLDSPANRNALSWRLVDDLHLALDRAEQLDVRAIVLAHTPPVFCAGMDLGERIDGTAVQAHETSTAFVRALERLEAATAPTIARVEGPVRAGGVGLMAACDLIVVRPDVDFAFTEVRLGLTPAIISVPILRRVAWSAVAPAFLTGERFDAASARSIGLVTHVADDVAATVAALVAGILAGGPGAVATTKRLLRAGGPADYASMRALSDELFASPEGVEGMRSFLERRPPSWAPADPAG